MMAKPTRRYDALIRQRPEPDGTLRLIHTYSTDFDSARAELEAKYSSEAVIGLWGELESSQDWNGMTVNERLSVAGIENEYYRLRAAGDLKALNELLANVKLRIDESGMHWSLPDEQGNATSA